jgi:hypothetical protein
MEPVVTAGQLRDDLRAPISVQAAVRPDVAPHDGGVRVAIERFGELDQVLPVARAPGCAQVLMHRHRPVVLATELEHVLERRMVDPCGLAVREVGEVIVAKQGVLRPTPERILLPHPLDVVDCKPVGGVDATDERREATLILRRKVDDEIGDQLIRERKVDARGVVVEVVTGLLRLERRPCLLNRHSEDDCAVDAGAIQGREDVRS